MPRARTVSIDEVRNQLGENAKARWYTTSRGQKYVLFERKHKFPRGNGIRLQFKLRKSRGQSLTDDLRGIKRSQERAEKQANVKRGNGLFDNPLSSRPTVIGVVRVIRKKQVGRLLRLQQQGKKLTRSQQRRLFNLAKKKGATNQSGAKLPKGTDPQTLIFLSRLSRR